MPTRRIGDVTVDCLPNKEVRETVTATDAQVRIMMREREKGCSQEQSAASANVRSRKTVAKYEQLGKLPRELKQPRPYRSRLDAFAADWPTTAKRPAPFISPLSSQANPPILQPHVGTVDL